MVETVVEPNVAELMRFLCRAVAEPLNTAEDLELMRFCADGESVRRIFKNAFVLRFFSSSSGSSRPSSYHPSCWDQNCCGTCSPSPRFLDGTFRRDCPLTSPRF